jgi:ribosomal-protein-alanine N-acetyltransferase
MGAASWTEEVPQLSAELVTVREIAVSDVPTLFELLTDPAVAEHVSSPPPSEEAFRGFVKWAVHQRTLGKSVCFGIVPHGLDAAVGMIQVRALDASFVNGEWGFALGKAFWGTGIFIQAADLVAGFAFTTLKVHRLEARAVCQNGRGNAVLQKIGAQPEAKLEQAFFKNGQFDRQFLWTLIEEDWRQRPLVRPQFSPVNVTHHIADAIQHTKQIIDAGKGERPTSRDKDFPFFLTG